MNFHFKESENVMTENEKSLLRHVINNQIMIIDNRIKRSMNNLDDKNESLIAIKKIRDYMTTI
jgi:uncharacterized protein (UPF0218 family)